MGGSEVKPHRSEVFRVQDYEQVEWEPYTNIKDPTYESNFVVLSHKSNPSLQVQKYQLFFNSQAEYVSYLETYYERKKYPSLVNSVHIEQTTKKNMCSTFHSASVYIERIHFRLFELIEIPLEEGLYIIEVALEGYSKMFLKTGYFKVFSDMIGINKQGKVKVWVNKNFSKNFPDFNKIDHNKSEFDFVIDLIKVIEAHIDFLPSQQKFSNFLSKKKLGPSFEVAKSLLYEYEKNYRLIHQKSMKSIILWIKKNNSRSAVNSSYQQPDIDRSEMQRYLKTSSYSTVSERPAQSPSNTVSQKKIQFNKSKTRKSNNTNTVLETNKIYLPLQIDTHHFGVNPQNRENNNTSLYLVNRDRDYGLEKVVQLGNPPPFLLRREKVQQLGERIALESSGKIPTKTVNKLPSVSFSYKSNELYSPQNIDSKHQEWFGDKKQQKTLEKFSKEKKKDFRKSLNLNNSSNEVEEKIKFFSSTGDTCQIDPDIARDLYSMKNILKQ